MRGLSRMSLVPEGNARPGRISFREAPYPAWDDGYVCSDASNPPRDDDDRAAQVGKTMIASVPAGLTIQTMKPMSQMSDATNAD